jgi:hypothetical protein
MELFDRRSRRQRLLDTALDLPNGIRSGVAKASSSKATKASLLAVAGAAGVTAASARISSYRRRSEAATDDS